MGKDLYADVKKELMALWGELRAGRNHLVPSRVEAIRAKMKRVKALTQRIGGVVQAHGDQLEGDVERFLSGEMDEADVAQMFDHALHLEQDTREL